MCVCVCVFVCLFVSNNSQFTPHHSTDLLFNTIRIYKMALINIAHFLSTNKMILLEMKIDFEMLFIKYLKFKVMTRLAVS
jgi:hypothetical protein